MSNTVWVVSEPVLTVEGRVTGYRTVLHVTDDHSVELSGDAANLYAYGIVELTTRAAYDAAVFNQFVFGLKTPPQLPVGVIKRDLQPDRPPVDLSMAAPFALEPSIRVVEETGRAYGVLKFTAPAPLVGQCWDIGDAFQHAMHTLQVRAITDLDNGYLKYLNVIKAGDDFDQPSMVYDVGLWMSDGQPEPTSQRLARALREAGAPTELVVNARDRVYDEYLGQDVFPEVQLLVDLRAAGLHEFAQRVIDGEFSPSKAEADAWMASEKGQSAFAALLKGAQPKPEQAPKPKPKKRRRRR